MKDLSFLCFLKKVSNMTYVIICILIILCVYFFIKSKKVRKLNEVVDQKNIEMLKESEMLEGVIANLYQKKQNLNNEFDDIKHEICLCDVKIQAKKQELKGLEELAVEYAKDKENLSKKAFENYCLILDSQYEKEEQSFKEDLDRLKEAYANEQMRLLQETLNIKADLEKIEQTRAAAIQANLREKEIEENSSFYCIEISDSDKSDIARLNALKTSLNKPRVLSMLIWQTWFQKPLKALIAREEASVTGIYKITNTQTKECYIGQAVDIGARWAEHCKCGLGIDTPAGNKLYKAMQEYGLYNFSFEILEKCTKEQLNEKEKYYIGLYQSYEFGYNSNRGIG